MSELVRSYGFALSYSVQSDVGVVRPNNEDSHGSCWLDDGSLFVIVADGMGGHHAGEVASGLAVQVVEDIVGREPEADPRERIYNALMEANEAIREEGKRSGTQGMGTTSVVAVCRGAEVHIGLIGDSRCYQFRRGHLLWRTVDHTRVQDLIDAGKIDEVEARTHPEAGMLTRALGHTRMADGRPLVPDVLAEPLVLEEKDALLMCSDGLHDLVEDWELGRIIAAQPPEASARQLIELARERGGHDNITVAVIVAGRVAGDFDEGFAPPTYDDVSPADDPSDVESTYDTADELPALPPAAPPEPPKNRLLIGIGLVVILLLLVLIFVLLIGLGVIVLA